MTAHGFGIGVRLGIDDTCLDVEEAIFPLKTLADDGAVVQRATRGWGGQGHEGR